MYSTSLTKESTSFKVFSNVSASFAKTDTSPSSVISTVAPVCYMILLIFFPPGPIRTAILSFGPGGKNIKSIIDQTGSTVDITDDGLVSVLAKDAETLEKTLKLIDSFVREVEYNEVYEGRVVSIMKFGAFMEILPGKEGLLHISEISPERVEKVEDVLSVGDVFNVRVISMEGGKISLSKKKV